MSPKMATLGVCPTFLASLSGTFLRRKVVVNQCFRRKVVVNQCFRRKVVVNQ